MNLEQITYIVIPVASLVAAVWMMAKQPSPRRDSATVGEWRRPPTTIVYETTCDECGSEADN